MLYLTHGFLAGKRYLHVIIPINYHLVSTSEMPSTILGTQHIKFHSFKQSHEISVTRPFHR